MTSPLLRAVLADPDAALREISRLDCEESLAEFARQAWHIIEPGTVLKWNWHLDVVAAYVQRFFEGRIKRLVVNIPPGAMKSLLFAVFGPAWKWTRNPEARIISLTNEIGLATRDNRRMRQIIESDWYRERWPKVKIAGDQSEKTLFENTDRGFRQGLGLTGNITGKRGNFLLIDDPVDAQKAFSDLVIKGANETYDNAVSSRLNDPEEDSIGLIMQRLRDNDLTGHLLSKKQTRWVHLRIPMEYEGVSTYDPVTDLGPGYEGLADPRTKAGELMFPARFSRRVVEALKEDLGVYGCNPYEAPILMSDLSMKSIGEIAVGDEVVGFAQRQRPDGIPGRMKLERALVLEVHSHLAPVVKMYLDSGEVIRCTEDHRWLLSRSAINGNRSMYGPVRLNRKTKLARICPPRLPVLSPEEVRLAGWLSGFYDGEGTVSLCRKTISGEYRDSANICFYQGAGRNLPLCEKLEYALRHFGFAFNYTEDERKPNKDAPCYGYRQYRLTGNDLPLYQRFLSIVEPTKWRDRIINGAYGANFIRQREQVVRIEPDGEAMVHALTTTTGNYVVWGLASSNSAGQLQQRPQPLGGGIIKKGYWRKWPKSKPMPEVVHVFASYDTAFTEKDLKGAAYSARTTWGVFHNEENGRDCAILLESWWKRVGYPELRKEAVRHFHEWDCDRMLVERKASGISLLQDLRRLHIPFVGYDPGKLDKVGRAHVATPVFESGLIFYPDRQWANDVIDFVSAFPSGGPPSADLTDTVTQAAMYLKRGWWLQPPDEDDGPVSESSDDEDDEKPQVRAAYG